jgi:hypothetical protein
MDHSELETMVADILNRQEDLSDWEITFISDMECHTHFSPKQADIINKIWDRVTS